MTGSDGGDNARRGRAASVRGLPLRRVALVLGVVVGALVGAVVIAAAGAWLFLRTERGGDVARRWALAQANARLAGQLSVDRLRFGGDRLTLTGLALRDPDGALVARIDSVDVRFAPWALLRRHVEIRSLAIARPALTLVQSPGGLNLTRALAVKTDGQDAKPAGAGGDRGSGTGGGVAVSLQRLDVSRASVDFRSDDPAAPVVTLNELAVSGGGHYHLGATPTFDLDVRAGGQARAPVAGDLAIAVTAAAKGGQGDARADVSLAGARLIAALRMGGPNRATLTLERLSLPGALVTAVAPAVPLRAGVTVTARGTLARAGDQAWLTATVSAGGGEIAAHGKLDLTRWRSDAEGIVVSGRRLDLSALLTGAPPSDLAFDLDAHGGGRDLASLEGRLALRVPEGRLGGRTVGPVRLSINMRPGIVTLAELVVRLPGVDVTGQGRLANGALDLGAVVDARNLAAAARSLAPPGGRPPVAMTGRGRAKITVGGTIEAPSLRVQATFPTLAVDDNRAHGLVVRTFTPNLRRPEASDIEVRARAAEFAGRSARGLVVQARASGDKITAGIRIAAPQPLDLAVAGRWHGLAAARQKGGGAAQSNPDPKQDLTIDTLVLRYPEETWTLSRPTRITFGPGHLTVRGIALTGGDQAISADVVQAGRALRGQVVVTRLDLARLPRALAPARLRLAGIVSIDARVKRLDLRPDVDVKVAVERGRIAGYQGIGLNVDAHVDGARARGTVDARGLGTSLRGDFDVPLAWPPRDRRAPLRLAIELADTDLAVAMKAIQQAMAEAAPTLSASTLAPSMPAPLAIADGATPASSAPRVLPVLRGRARLSLVIRGSVEDPHLQLSVATHALVVDKRAIGDLSLNVAGDGDAPLHLQVGLTAVAPPAGAGHASLTGRGTFDLRASQSLRALMASLTHGGARPPSRTQLLHTRLQLVADLDGLPLAGLAPLVGYRPAVGGALSVHVDLQGTALAPRGKVSLDVAGATTGKFPPTDGRLLATFGDHDSSAHIEIDRKGKPLLAVDARLDVGAAALGNLTTLTSAPLRVRATLSPLQLQRLGLPPQTDRDPPRVLKGMVRAGLAVDGSLRAPIVELKVDAADIRLDKVLVGEAHAAVTYAAGQPKLDARLFSANRGSLRVEAATRADLGYPAVLRRVDVDRLPVTARIRAQGFDLQGFSGVTAGLRQVGGLLFAEAQVSGTLADPQLAGRVEWKDGAVTVTGFGEYRAIHLLAHGDRQNLVLDELRVGSGGGHARVTATANHVPIEGYRYTAHADVQKFPIYSQGQALATVSLDVSARGAASPLKIRSNLQIKESRVVLSDAKRREIQSLKRPADIVLIDDGKPLNDAQAKKLRALATSSRAAAVADARAAGASSSSSSSPTVPPVVVPPPPPPGREIHLRVDAPRNLWVTGKDAYLELGLSSPFRIVIEDAPQVFGEVKVLRGRIDLFGRRFDVKQPSTMRFDGPPDRPDVDVQAQYTNENENVTVVVTAKGPVDRLRLVVSSPNRPELGESQLYTLIITGRLQLGGGSSGGAGSASPSAQAVSLMGGLIASKLQKALANKLPLDVLTIDAGGAGLTGTQLEAGTYLTDKLYVGYVGRVGADPMRYQNRNAVHLEYQLTPRWSFDGEYGDVGTGSADLIWTKSY